jgi:hypothetical protein
MMPNEQIRMASVPSNAADPFGLSASASTTSNAFGNMSDPFGSARADDPFMSTAPATIGLDQKLDESDPFRPVNFNSAQESNRKSMGNRSKTPGANMFGGNDFTPFSAPATNRPQSAMPWEPTHQVPPQPGTQAFNDLFDIFG